jgi:hypothetical protein
MLREQIRLGCLCADRRQVYDSAWTCCLNRRSQRGGYRSRLAKVRQRIEVRWNEHEDPVHSPKGRRKSRRVIDICFDQVAAELRPGFAFADLANYGSNGLASGQKVTRHFPTHIACDSGHCKHWLSSCWPSKGTLSSDDDD